jgi:hypothetical protein
MYSVIDCWGDANRGGLLLLLTLHNNDTGCLGLQRLLQFDPGRACECGFIPNGLPGALTGAFIAEIADTLAVVLRHAINDGVQRFWLSVWRKDGIKIWTAAVGEKDSELQVDLDGFLSSG